MPNPPQGSEFVPFDEIVDGGRYLLDIGGALLSGVIRKNKFYSNGYAAQRIYDGSLVYTIPANYSRGGRRSRKTKRSRKSRKSRKSRRL